jgi:hypothetical protein
VFKINPAIPHEVTRFINDRFMNAANRTSSDYTLSLTVARFKEFKKAMEKIGFSFSMIEKTTKTVVKM